MSLVRSADGRWWYTCEDLTCPAFEHPEDLHSHELVLRDLSPQARADLRAAVEAEICKRKYRGMKDLTGRRVKLNRRARRRLRRHHWDEFGRPKLRGTVIGHPYPGWPEWDVLWDNGLKYSYKRDWLDVLP